MQKHRRLLCFVLALLLALGMVPVSQAEEESPVTHIGTSTVALKVRRAPSSSAAGNDSIPRGSFVYVIEYGSEWCKVRTSRNEGWVMTKYLSNLQTVEGYEEPTPAQEVGEAPMPGFTTTRENFHEGYIAHGRVDGALIYQAPTENSRIVGKVGGYEQVTVSEVSGEWCLARKGSSVYGYIRTRNLFKWDRIDPYVGEIPGLDVWTNLAFVKRTTSVRSLETGKELVTVNPGSAIAVGEKDAMGRYRMLYHREYAYIAEEDVAYVMPVVSWENARSGDLISVMTTFFAVGKTTLQYQGRNWNIHLASGMISGTVLQPNEGYNMNRTIGPYKQTTGYKSAPIMSDKALSGYGGGTCQVNTTFYITTVQLPLLVTHRKVHANVGMYYAMQGFDAAVGGGDINLTMVNTLPYAIRYEFMNSDGVLTCCIFRN